MAVTPVLERKVNTEENVTAEVSRTTTMSADECHNSRIKVNYAKLINPDTTVGDVLPKEPVRQQQQVIEPVRAQRPYLVEGARAKSDLFRADSAINSRQVEEAHAEEEENEDLRPTDETIKYKSGATGKLVIDDKISNKQTKVSKMKKRDKVVLAVALLIIAALFVLVIINSAVLSNLNSEISSLQANLETVKDSYAETMQNKEAYFEPQNILRVVSEFAQKLGMIKL